MTYTVTRQLQWAGEAMVEISEGGFDYVNPDMLTQKYDQEGETFDNPNDAVDAAIEILKQWRRDLPGVHIGIGYGATLGFTMPFDQSDVTEIKDWAQKRYEALPKCDRCGDIITEEYKLVDDCFDQVFCSEQCTNRAFEDQYIDEDGDY